MVEETRHGLEEAPKGDRYPGSVDLTQNVMPGDAMVDPKRGPESIQDKDQALLEEMRTRVALGRTWWEPNWERANQDVEFLYGSQWDSKSLAVRGKNRPALTLNVLCQHVNQVTGAARQSKLGISVSEIGGVKTHRIPVKDSESSLSYSEVMEGLIRDISYRSDLPHEAVRAFQHSVEGGFGWLRVLTTRAPDNPFELELRVEHVLDRWSVMLDPHSGKNDFSDAMWGCVSAMMPRREFEARYPEAVGDVDFYSQGSEIQSWWGAKDQKRVLEYWWKEPVKRTVLRLRKPDAVEEIVVWEENVRAVLDDLKSEGYEVEEKEVNSYRVKYMKCTQNAFLERPQDWPGTRIPLVPVLGREVNTKDMRLYEGLIRHSHDAQRMYNYWFSAMTERVSQHPRAPYLVTPAQIAGHREQWAQANERNSMYMLFNADPEVGGQAPKREAPPSPPAAEMAIMGTARSAIYDALGMHEASIGQPSNERSGKAILARQQEGDTATYEFLDRLANSMKDVGEILIELIPLMHTNKEIVRLRLEDGSTATVLLNERVVDEKTGAVMVLSNLTMGRYRARADVGPAYQTQKREFVEMMREWGRTDPEGFRVSRDVIIENMDFPGNDAVAKRFKSMVPRELLSEEEQASLPEPQPSPEAQAEMAKAQSAVAIKELELEKEKVQLEIAMVNLEAAKAKAVTQDAMNTRNLEADAKRKMAQELAAQ